MTTTPAEVLRQAREALAYYATAGKAGELCSGDIATDALAAIDALPSAPAADIDEAQLARLSERGAVAWAGVTDDDIRALRDGSAPSGEPAAKPCEWTNCPTRVGDVCCNDRAPTAPAPLPAFDILAHLKRQAEFSAKTFGPGARVEGVTDHIAKELREVRESGGDLSEWVDVIILAFDGAWRSGASPAQIIDAMVAKQTKNEGRKWPDWRTVPADKAIEHDRTGEVDAAPLLSNGLTPSETAAIDMVLHCPACGLQHIDAPEELPMATPGSFAEGSAGWVNPPHRSHLCHGCGHIWRPADVPTNGVDAVKTKGKADSPIAVPAGQAATASVAGLAEPGIPDYALLCIQAYGDARADDDGTSAARLREAILELRRWAGSLATKPQEAPVPAPSDDPRIEKALAEGEFEPGQWTASACLAVEKNPSGALAIIQRLKRELAAARTPSAAAAPEPVATILTWHKNGQQHADLMDWRDALASLPDGTHDLYTAAPAVAEPTAVPLTEREADKWIPTHPTHYMTWTDGERATIRATLIRAHATWAAAWGITFADTPAPKEQQ